MVFYPVFVIGLCFLAALKFPAAVIAVGSVLIIAGFRRLLMSLRWLPLSSFVLFAWGNYLAESLFRLGTSFATGSMTGMGVGMGFAMICGVGIRAGSRVESRLDPLH